MRHCRAWREHAGWIPNNAPVTPHNAPYHQTKTSHEATPPTLKALSNQQFQGLVTSVSGYLSTFLHSTCPLSISTRYLDLAAPHLLLTHYSQSERLLRCARRGTFFLGRAPEPGYNRLWQMLQGSEAFQQLPCAHPSPTDNHARTTLHR